MTPCFCCLINFPPDNRAHRPAQTRLENETSWRATCQDAINFSECRSGRAPFGANRISRPGPFEKRHTQVRFQGFEPTAYRGLGDNQRLCRLAEMPRPVEFQEGSQQFQVLTNL